MDATLRWLCVRCAKKLGLKWEREQKLIKCAECGVETYCKIAAGPAFHRVSINIPVVTYRVLMAKADSIGCSLSSLIKTYIDEGLHPKIAAFVPTYTAEIVQRQTQTLTTERRIKSSGPAGYQAPSYFNELKEVLEKRKKKKG